MSKNAVIHICCDYIDDHLMVDLNMEELALYCGYSFRQLERLFRQQIGVSISEYIRFRRVNRGLYHIIHGMKIKDAAELLGYSGSYAFGRAVYLEYGLTPRDLKAHLRHTGVYIDEIKLARFSTRFIRDLKACLYSDEERSGARINLVPWRWKNLISPTFSETVPNKLEIDGIKETRSQHPPEIDGIKETRSQHPSGIDGIKEASSQHPSEIDGIKETSSQHPSEIDGIKETSSQHPSEIDGIKETRSQHTSEIDGIKENRSQYPLEIDEIKETSSPYLPVRDEEKRKDFSDPSGKYKTIESNDLSPQVEKHSRGRLDQYPVISEKTMYLIFPIAVDTSLVKISKSSAFHHFLRILSAGWILRSEYDYSFQEDAFLYAMINAGREEKIIKFCIPVKKR